MWGFSPLLVKSVAIPPLAASFYRLWFGVALLWALAGVRGRHSVAVSWKWLGLCSIGGACFAVHQIFFFLALDSTRVANVTIIAALQPALIVFVAARIFAEPVAWRALPYLGVAFVGVACVIIATSGQPGVAPYGDLLAIANLLAFSAYFLATKWVRNQLRATEYITGMTTAAAVMLSTILVAAGHPLPPPSATDALLLLTIAALPGSIGHTLMGWAHPLLSAFTISSMILVVPVISSLAAVPLLDEPLRAGQIAGGGLALAGVAMILRITASTGQAAGAQPVESR
jgi:drug/metabolite transporter (DMT)-like permease